MVFLNEEGSMTKKKTGLSFIGPCLKCPPQPKLWSESGARNSIWVYKVILTPEKAQLQYEPLFPFRNLQMGFNQVIFGPMAVGK